MDELLEMGGLLCFFVYVQAALYVVFLGAPDYCNIGGLSVPEESLHGAFNVGAGRRARFDLRHLRKVSDDCLIVS